MKFHPPFNAHRVLLLLGIEPQRDSVVADRT